MEEDLHHCLINCSRVTTVWRKVWAWWQLGSPNSFPSLFIWDIAIGKVVDLGCARLNKMVRGVLHCTLWAIWKWRNKVVNAQMVDVANSKVEDVFPLI